MNQVSAKDWIRGVIKSEENSRFLQSGKDFINDELLSNALINNQKATKEEIRTIIQKAKNIQSLTIDETAKLLFVTDNDLWNEINEADKLVLERLTK